MDQFKTDTLQWREASDVLFLDVAKFCSITGFAQSTVYEQIRQGRFFLPIVLVGRKPYIATEDFNEWYLNRGRPKPCDAQKQ